MTSGPILQLNNGQPFTKLLFTTQKRCKVIGRIMIKLICNYMMTNMMTTTMDKNHVHKVREGRGGEGRGREGRIL